MSGTRILSGDTHMPVTDAETIAAIEEVVSRHNDVDRARLTFACVECGTIGEVNNTADRDTAAVGYDYTCCDPASTYVFVSQ